MRHRIAVVGGGPAGLTFARVLHRHGHPVAVLERDPTPDARPRAARWTCTKDWASWH